MKILFLGFSFDITTGLFFITTYNIFLLALPKKWIGSLLDKTFTYCYCFIVLLLMYFSLMAEIPFWDEFGVRFNFIAVDYLIYTY
ncbi:LTA synthase family protein, partial [Chryseobacterium indologenes]|nr:LTA synthase family protein [Chryseobacterium indologenes]